MIHSVLAQVLEQYPSTPETIANDVNFGGIDAGDI